MPRGKSDVCLSRKGRKARSKVLFNGVCLFVANEGLAGYKFGQIRPNSARLGDREGDFYCLAWWGGVWACGPGSPPTHLFFAFNSTFLPTPPRY